MPARIEVSRRAGATAGLSSSAAKKVGPRGTAVPQNPESATKSRVELNRWESTAGQASSGTRRGLTRQVVLVKTCCGLLFTIILLTGCGGGQLDARIVEGRVTSGGEPVELGQIRFVPIDGTSGPASVATIRDGHYRIEARGGVPFGKHRVEIDAQKRTGRMVLGDTGFEQGMIEETLRIRLAASGGSDRRRGPVGF